MEWGRSKKEALNFLKYRIHRRLKLWKQKLLPQSGKEVLVESVIAVSGFQRAGVRR